MMTEGLLLLLKVSVGLLILAIGMGSTFSDLAYLWRRPGLLVRSLLAIYVLVPLAALVLVTLLPLAPGRLIERLTFSGPAVSVAFGW